jgi:BirA family transcriptional regulator, biotin operon repressor / biotin---[acetyl-CoA-carboxylase] ligase
MDPIKSLPFVEKVFRFESIDSTNTFAKSLDTLPKQGMYVVCADRQSAGRGQRDNSFFSEIPHNLFVSVVCPLPDLAGHFSFNRSISCAICDAIESCEPGAVLSIKWPNDIYLRDRKLAGILLETTGRRSHIIIGFGINCNVKREQFPSDIRNTATSLCIETGRFWETSALLHAILGRFRDNCRLDASSVHRRYTGKLYKIGSKAVIAGRTGIFEGVLEDGRICLAVNGRTMYFMSGPVLFIP